MIKGDPDRESRETVGIGEIQDIRTSATGEISEIVDASETDNSGVKWKTS